MNYKIDLIGKDQSKAIRESEDSLVKLAKQGSFNCELIIGNNPTLRAKIIDEVLMEWNFEWTQAKHNRTSLIVHYDYMKGDK